MNNKNVCPFHLSKKIIYLCCSPCQIRLITLSDTIDGLTYFANKILLNKIKLYPVKNTDLPYFRDILMIENLFRQVYDFI